MLDPLGYKCVKKTKKKKRIRLSLAFEPLNTTKLRPNELKPRPRYIYAITLPIFQRQQLKFYRIKRAFQIRRREKTMA